MSGPLTLQQNRFGWGKNLFQHSTGGVARNFVSKKVGNDFLQLHYTFSSAPTPSINNDRSLKRKGKKEFTETVLAFFHRQRTRTLWMHPRTQIWFEMVDDTYNDELWYANFRVTKETFTFILRKVEPERAHENTHLREAVSAKRRLAVTLYYLAPTAEYCTIGNLFGVSRGRLCASALKKYVMQ